MTHLFAVQHLLSHHKSHLNFIQKNTPQFNSTQLNSLLDPPRPPFWTPLAPQIVPRLAHVASWHLILSKAWIFTKHRQASHTHTPHTTHHTHTHNFSILPRRGLCISYYIAVFRWLSGATCAPLSAHLPAGPSLDSLPGRRWTPPPPHHFSKNMFTKEISILISRFEFSSPSLGWAPRNRKLVRLPWFACWRSTYVKVVRAIAASCVVGKRRYAFSTCG